MADVGPNGPMFLVTDETPLPGNVPFIHFPHSHESQSAGGTSPA